MKQLIISLAFLLSLPAVHAGPGGGGGGIGTVPTLRMLAEINTIKDFLDRSLHQLDRHEVEALRTLSGDYARLEDIEEGFVHFSGAVLRNGLLELRPKSNDFEIESIIFVDGSEIEFEPTQE